MVIALSCRLADLGRNAHRRARAICWGPCSCKFRTNTTSPCWPGAIWTRSARCRGRRQQLVHSAAATSGRQASGRTWASDDEADPCGQAEPL